MDRRLSTAVRCRACAFDLAIDSPAALRAIRRSASLLAALLRRDGIEKDFALRYEGWSVIEHSVHVVEGLDATRRALRRITNDAGNEPRGTGTRGAGSPDHPRLGTEVAVDLDDAVRWLVRLATSLPPLMLRSRSITGLLTRAAHEVTHHLHVLETNRPDVAKDPPITRRE